MNQDLEKLIVQAEADVVTLREEATKFSAKGVKAAAPRARKAAQNLVVGMKAIRTMITELKS